MMMMEMMMMMMMMLMEMMMMMMRTVMVTIVAGLMAQIVQWVSYTVAVEENKDALEEMEKRTS